jgi:hypothetical protein
MTVSSTVNLAGPYNGNGVTTSFSFSFAIFAASDLEVVHTSATDVETTLVLSTDYTVSVAAYPGSGSISYPVSGSPLPTGEKITLRRVLTKTQTTDFRNQGGFYARNHEDAFDRAAMIDQEGTEVQARTLKLPVSDTSGADPTLPPPAANKAFAWDATGLALIEVDDANASASAAASSASAASSSATAAASSASAAATSFDDFDDRYLGSKSSAPSLDNDGNALLAGALYWDTVITAIRVYDGGSWNSITTSTLASLGISSHDQVTVTSSGQLRVGDGSVSAPSLSFAGDTDMGFYHISANVMGLAASGAERFRFGVSTSYFFVSETSNAGYGEGNITQNQQNGDAEIITWKSSDIAHGSTGQAETDTYGLGRKQSAASGGLEFLGLSEDERGLTVSGLYTNDNTTRTTSGRAGVMTMAAKISGTGHTAPGANAALFAVGNYNADTVHFIIDEDGDYHYDGADGGAFDEYDDALMARALDLEVNAKHIIRNEFDDFARTHQGALVKAGILGEVDPDNPRHYHKDGTLSRPMINGAQLQRLHNGAIWQQRAMFETMKKTLGEIIPGFDMKLANALKAQSLPALPI